MSSTRRLRSGRYQVRWRNPDRSVAARTFTTKGDAKEHERVTQRCEELGLWWKPEEKPAAVPWFGDGVTAFMKRLEETHAASTVRQYRDGLTMAADALDASGFGEMTVGDISIEHLRIFRAWLEDRATARRTSGRAPDTIRRLVEKLEACWAWLFETEFHPAVPRPRSLELPKAPLQPVRAPTFEEMARCVLATRGEYRRLTTVAYFTGLRISQVLGLDWSLVDFEHELLTVPGHLCKTERERAGRIIPLSPHLISELATWGERVGPIVTISVTRQARERAVHAAWRAAGVRDEIHKQRPDHAFRRGFVSGLKRLGADDEAVEFYVGHSIAGARGRYIDGDAMPLRELAALIPPIVATNVVALQRKDAK